jgi:lipoyl(octanoyl) transferase
LIDYKQAWEYQEKLLQRLVSEKSGNGNKNNSNHHLLFCEHPNVFTLGKSGTQNNLLINKKFLDKIDATYYKIDRGGDITYHGPGQLVVYPIFDLDSFKIGLRSYINKLEDSISRVLREYNIIAGKLEGATGVWLDTNNNSNTRKICAIGVRVSRSVTMHGLAFNINTDLRYFDYINPCGFTDKGVSSMENELGVKQNFSIVSKKLLQELETSFNLEILN